MPLELFRCPADDRGRTDAAWLPLRNRADKAWNIASLGVAAYAIGKFPAGAMADYFGGRRNFLGGMVGSVFFTVVFALSGGLPLFTLAWGRQPFRTVLGLGRHGEGIISLVFLSHVWHSDGHSQSEFPFW